MAAGDTRAAGIGGGGLINNGAAVNGTIHIYRGTIEATGGSWAAGIGGGADSITNCTILIDGGTIKAMGGENNTGIGGTDGSKEIIINGGNITAYGSGYGAGIGGSYNASGGTITITGGVIDAGSIGGGNAAGGGSGGTIEISGGVVTAERIGAGGNNKEGTFSTGRNGNAVIFAGAITDHDDTSAWNGIIFEDGDGKIYGSSYTVDENLTIPADNTLTIEDGKTLTVAGGVSFENNGTIEVSNGGTYMGSQPTGNKVTYQIDWDTDGDGDVDDTAFVAYGKTPTHEDGEKAGTAEFIYEFTGWTPDVATVTGTATYTATFTERARSYKVTVPTDEGYTVKYSGSTTVPYDSEFSFTVEIARGYYKTSGFAVKANGEPLTAGADGGYTVRVLANTQITVEGVAGRLLWLLPRWIPTVMNPSGPQTM